MNWFNGGIKLADTVRSYIAKGDIDKLAPYLSTPEDIDKVEKLMRKHEYSTMLSFAFYHRNPLMIQYLLGEKKIGIDEVKKDNINGLNYLSKALNAGDTEVMRLLVDSGLDMRNAEPQWLAHAIRYKDGLNIFLDGGMSPQNEFAFSKIAANPEYNDQYQVLIDAGAAPEKLEAVNEVFLHAVRANNIYVVKDLLDRQPELIQLSTLAQSAIVYHKDNTVLDYLVSKGFEPWKFEISDVNLLLFVVSNGNKDLFERVIDYAHQGKVDVHVTDKYGNNAVHLLAKRDNLIEAGGLEKLISVGADIHAMNHVDATPLFSAIEQGNLALVKQLVRKNVDMDIEDKSGHTPLSIAQSEGQTAIYDFLKTAGAGAAAKKIEQSGGNWHKLDDVSIASVSVHIPIAKKITEIFNFESHDRVTIIDDLSPERPSVTMRDKFEDIEKSVLSKAFTQYKEQKGTLSETEALYGMGEKTQATTLNFGQAGVS